MSYSTGKNIEKARGKAMKNASYRGKTSRSSGKPFRSTQKYNLEMASKMARSEQPYRTK